EPRLHLSIGVLGETDSAGLSDTFQARGNIDAVAHQVAVALLDHVAQMDANAKLDSLLRRKTSITIRHTVLHLDGRTHGIDYASKLDDCSVACALDDAAMMQRDGWVDEVAAQRPQAR